MSQCTPTKDNGQEQVKVQELPEVQVSERIRETS